jgi:hypothetical protein
MRSIKSNQSGIVLDEGVEAVKTGFHGAVALMHELLLPFQKELCGLLLEPLHNCSLDILV